MSVEAPPAPVSTPAPPAPSGDVAIPEISSIPAGAQGVRPAPPGTIPPPMTAYSDRPDSAKSKMLERMKGRSKVQPAPEAPKPAAAPTPPPEAPAPEPEVSEDDDLLDATGKSQSPEKSPETPKTPETPETPADPKNPKAKINPWKLAEEHKAARAKAELELLEMRKLVPNVEERKKELEKYESVKKRAEELEKHIKFVDYTKSEEYQTTYEKPYIDQWKTSMRELNGVTILDDEMGARAIEPNDVLKLVNEPTIKARQMARELFGEYADDVMRERDKIVGLHNAKITAVEKARNEGVEKYGATEKEQREKFEALNTEVKTTYEKAVEALGSNSKLKEYFQPIEGDEEANNVLAKGYELVEKAFKSNPMDPNLTPEQRASVVKLHAAIRHRTAGFGRAKYLHEREKAAHEVTKKKLAQYEQTVPNRGPTTPPPVQTTNGGSKLSQMQARLRGLASKGP